MRKLLQVFLLLVLIVSYDSARAQISPLTGAYTINAGQATGAKNYQSFEEAVQSLALNGVSGPVVFNVAPNSGPYNEQINLNPINGTSAINTVTFFGNGNLVNFISTNASNKGTVKLDGAKHIIFDSLKVAFTVTTEFEFGTGFHLLRDADSNIIRKCEVEAGMLPTVGYVQNYYGIVIDGSDDHSVGLGNCDYNIISGNKVTGGYYGIWVSNWDQNMEVITTANNNQIINNTVISPRNAGIYLMRTDNTLVQGNTITGSLTDWSFSAINANEGCFATHILENRIHGFKNADPTASYNFNGISFFGCKAAPGKENVVANNLIYDVDANNNFRGIEANYLITGLNVYNNTFYVNTAADKTVTGFYSDATVEVNGSNIQIKNNIFSLSNSGTARAYGAYFENALTMCDIDRNDYYLVTATANRATPGYYKANYNTLETWRTATGFDLLTRSIDPVFTDAAAFNFKPTAAELDNRGVYVGVAKDIAGVNRNTSFPDPGAYEFGSSPCTTPVVAGATGIFPGTTVCEGSIVALDLTGNSAGDGQSYQWVSSATENGEYTNLDGALQSSAHTFTAATPVYIKARVTCGTDTKLSDAVLLNVNPLLPAGIYTINNQAPTGNRNYNSFADAIRSMDCGIAGPIQFEVAAGSGPYTEQITIPKIKGASAINTVTFNGNDATLTYGASVSARKATLVLSNASHTIIKNLNIATTAATNAIAINITNNSDSNVIRKCTISAPSLNASSIACIVFNGGPSGSISSGASNSDYNVIDSNIIKGGYYGISMNGSDFAGGAACAVNNSFTGNTIQDFFYYGFYMTYNTNTLLEGNDFSRPNATAGGTVYAVWYGPTLEGANVNRNKIHDLFANFLTSTGTAYGIRVAGANAPVDKPNMITNNLVYNFHGTPTQYGIYVQSNSENTKIYHNTVSIDDTSATFTRGGACFYLNNDAPGIELKNNLFTMRRKVSARTYAMYINRATYQIVSDNNNAFIDQSSSFLYTGYLGGTLYKTMDDWKGAGFDANSWGLNPGYADPANGNFKPTVMALANKGAALGVVRDILGTRRNTNTPDVGAYEFACEYPAKGVAKADSIAVCEGTAATFEVNAPATGANYLWYDQAYYPGFTEGQQVGAGNTFTTPVIPGDSVIYYLETVAVNGCGDAQRHRVKAVALPKLTQAPVVHTAAVTGETATFAWDAVPGAKGYEVSRNYIDFTLPSSGAQGRTHVVTGLNGGDTLSLVVKATADLTCQAIVSDTAFARTLTYNFFVPNMFSPNGDGKNDEFRVYGNTIASLKLMVFNQWGEKVFETADKFQGWNGTYSGNPLPVGVYVYVAQMTFTNGSAQTSKGTVSLIR